MKRALIITYYWPPCGGAAVQRWLKFTKYLRDFGWEPVVYTAENGEYPMLDYSLEKEVPEGIEVLKQPVWEPYSIYKKLTGRKKQETLKPEIVTATKKNSFSENLAIWIRGNFFIPDARKFWIKPSVKFLKEYLETNPVDVIISSSPPQSVHLIALELSGHFNIPWLSDFRDPWTKVDYFDRLKLSHSAEEKHKALEREVLKSSSATLTVSWNWANDFREMGAKRVEVITNGYDSEDMLSSIALDEKFTIAHIGNLSKDRVHESLFVALNELSKEVEGFSKELKLKLVGDVDASFPSFCKKYGLKSNAEFLGAVSHEKAMKETCSAQVLLLLLGAKNKSLGRIPLKVFEYMAAKRPIICLGPETGDVAKIITESKSGQIVDFNDKENLKKGIICFYEKYKQGKLEVAGEGIEKYSRRKLTSHLAEVLNEVVGEFED